MSLSHTQTCRLGPIKWLSVSEKEGLTLPLRQDREKCLSLFAAPLFSHLGHNVGYRLVYVYSKYVTTLNACL